MKVIFHENFYHVYTADPAASAGRMEAVVKVIEQRTEFLKAEPASEEDILAVHSQSQVDYVRRNDLYDIAALAAGGALQSAEIGLKEPCFALIRPPGHHASKESSWGFCYFNNMAVAIESLKRRGMIKTAFVLDIDLHYGDGNVDILGNRDYVTVRNIDTHNRVEYLKEVKSELANCNADIIGISAGFDNHEEDWGGVLKTEDYHEIGEMAKSASKRIGGGCFAILEGGYNHDVLGQNVMALIEGMDL